MICIFVPAIASACSCRPSGPPCEAAWRYSVVFAGTVVDLTEDAFSPARVAEGFLHTRVIFEVNEPFVGMEGRGKRIEIRTGSGGGDCGYKFERLKKYVVYASESRA